MSNATAGVDAKAINDHSGHHLNFYEEGSFISGAVAEFLAGGIRVGQPVVLIATPEHRDEIFGQLILRGSDVQDLAASGSFTWLDARETLSKFMAGNMPNEQRFVSCLGEVIEASRSGREHMTIRAFGEMVDLLMREGNPAGALRLEELWNQIGKTYGFSLLCAYSIGDMYREKHWRYFRQICDQHIQPQSERKNTIRMPFAFAENGETCKQGGVFKNVCCSAEIAIGRGATFPDCPKHPKFPTIWKQIRDENER